MASLNKVMLIGNLTKDPELRYTPQGSAVANLRLAVNRKYKNKNQELKDETCFINVVVWNKQAETVNQYLHKGSQMFVEGRLQSRSWDDQQTGQKRSVIEVMAERIQFLGAPSGRGTQSIGAQEQEDAAPAAVDGASETAWLNEAQDETQ